MKYAVNATPAGNIRRMIVLFDTSFFLMRLYTIAVKLITNRNVMMTYVSVWLKPYVLMSLPIPLSISKLTVL